MFPTPHTVQVVRRVRSGENAVGQPVYSTDTRSIKVYGWQSTSQEDRHTAVLNGRTVSELQLLSPTGDFRPSDAVIINGVTYEVAGDVEDFNHGPFGFTPGYVIGLRKVTNA